MIKNYSEVAKSAPSPADGYERKSETPSVRKKDDRTSLPSKSSISTKGEDVTVRESEDLGKYTFWLAFWEDEFKDLEYLMEPLFVNKKEEFPKLLYFLYRSREKVNECNRDFFYFADYKDFQGKKGKKKNLTPSNVTQTFAIEYNLPILLSSYRADYVDQEFGNWYYKHIIGKKKLSG